MGASAVESSPPSLVSAHLGITTMQPLFRYAGMGLNRSRMRLGGLSVLVLAILGSLISEVLSASCFPDESTTNLYCCGGTTLTVDTGSSGGDDPTLTSDGTVVTCNSVSEGEKDVAECIFDDIVIDDTTVTVEGTRALRLVSKAGITIDETTIDGTPSEVSDTLCSGRSHWRVGVLGGFDGGRAAGTGSVGSTGESGESPTGVTGASGVNEEVKQGGSFIIEVGGGGGSAAGTGGTSRVATSPRGRPGSTFMTATSDLMGGGGGGGGGNGNGKGGSPDPCEAHGGAGGGALALVAQDGDIWIGPTAVIRMNGGDSTQRHYGGAGAGGMIVFQAPGANDVVLTKGSKVEAKGGYVYTSVAADSSNPLYGEDVLGGGGAVIFKRYSGSATADAIFEDASISVVHGGYLCTSSGGSSGAAACDCQTFCGTLSDGSTLYGTGIARKIGATVPTDTDDATSNIDAVCNTVTATLISATGKCCWKAVGGETLDVRIEMPIADSSRRIDANTDPTITVGGVSCTSTSWVNPSVSSTSTENQKATARCTTAANVGKDLDVVVSWNGGESATLAKAVSISAPTISSFSTPSASRRWTRAGTGSSDIEYSITLTGTHYGSSSFSSDAEVTVGGRPCVSTSITSDTSISCTVPANVGKNHAVILTLAGQSVTASSTFSYSPPEIHAFSLPSAYSTNTNSYFNTEGGETLTILGVNFGHQYWDTTTSSVKTMVASKISVSVATNGASRSCTSIAWVTDRKITCSTPAGVGQELDVSVTVASQTTTSSSSADSRSYLRTTYSESDTFNNNVGLDDGFTNTHPPTFNYSYPRLTSVEVFPSQDVSAGSTTSEILMDTKGSETFTLKGDNFGPSADGATTKPKVYILSTTSISASSVTRSSDNLLSVTSPSGVGKGYSIRVSQHDRNDGSSIGLVPARFYAPRITALSVTSGLAQAGDETLAITGKYFGLVGASGANHIVYFGEWGRCAPVTHVADDRLECKTPPGTDANVLVKVQTGEQNSTATTFQVTYKAPSVSAISPTYAFSTPAGSDLRYNFTITGTSLGSSASQLKKVTIGGATCPELAWDSSTSIRCLNLGGRNWDSSHVVVHTGNQHSGLSNPLFRHIGAPAFILTDDTKSGPTDAVTTLEFVVSGDTFGLVASDITSILLRKGSTTYYTCTNIRLLGSLGAGFTAKCDLSGGVGASFGVDVFTRGGKTNTPNTFFSFDPPTITKVTPNDVATLPGEYRKFYIEGSNFGNSLEGPSKALVGGQLCDPVVFVNSSFLECRNVSMAQWKETAVRVTVGGVEGQGNVFSFTGSPTIVGIVPSSAPTTGNVWMNITGSNLGAGNGESDLSFITVGGVACLEIDSTNGGDKARCLIPPGVGAKLTIAVKTKDGLRAAIDNLFSYNPPTISSISPNSVVTGALTYEVVITGTNLAARSGTGGVDTGVPSPEDVTVGGVSCASITATSSKSITCGGISASSGFTSNNVVVRVGQQRTTATNILTTYGRPIVLAITPSEVVTRGGVNISITGSDFGASINDVDRVRVGTRECLQVSYVASNQLICTTPPGVGRLNRVYVRTIGLLESTNAVHLSYSPPTILTTSPSHLLTGPLLTYSFNITGLNLASSLDSPAAGDVSVAGRSCASVEVIDDTFLKCHGVSAADGWDGSLVSVKVGGQSGSASGLVSTLGSPVITFLSPSLHDVDGGNVMDINGISFGWNAEDIEKVVVADGVCESVTLVSTSLIRCTVPPGTGSSRIVQVSTRAGLQSPAATLFTYNPPSLSSITPDFAVTGPGLVYEFWIRGQNLGFPASSFSSFQANGRSVAQLETLFHPSSVRVGGRECPEVYLMNSSALLCGGMNASDGWSSTDVSVTTRSQVGTLTAQFSFHGQPRVVTVDPSGTVSQHGNVSISVLGANFGRSRSDLLPGKSAVTINSSPCEITSHSPTLLKCNAPAGVGAGLDVRVTNRALLSSASNRLFSYAPPSVTGARPNRVLNGRGFKETIRIYGSNLGLTVKHVDTLEIAGIACPSSSITLTTAAEDGMEHAGTLPITPSTQVLLCINHTATASTSYTFPSTTITIAIAGQEINVRNSITVYREPRVELVDPRTAPTSGHDPGGTKTVLVKVVDVGSEETDLTQVFVSNEPCNWFVFRPPNDVFCSVPPGVGANLDVSVQTRGGLRSTPNTLFSYEKPTISSISPARLYSGVLSKYNVTAIGTGFGNSQEDITAFSIGARVCPSFEWVSPNQVICKDVTPPWSTKMVDVVVGGQSSASNELVQVIPTPTIVALDPDSTSVVGGYVVRIRGTNLALQLEDILAVKIGTYSITAPSLLSLSNDLTLLRARVPPGLGRYLPVQVQRVDGEISAVGGDVPTWSYSTPSLSTSSPSHLLSGDYLANVTIQGTNIAPSSTYIAGVEVGGVSCVDVNIISAGMAQPDGSAVDASMSLECGRLDAREWSSQDVIIRHSDGSFFRFSSVVSLYDAPSVSKLEPASGPTDGGSVVRLLGTNFGASGADIADIFIGSTPVSIFSFVSATELSITIPPGVGRSHDVRVVSAVGTAAVGEALWSYSRPIVDTTFPSYTYVEEVGFELKIIRGTGFGNTPQDLVAIEIVTGVGSSQAVASCPIAQLVWFNSTAVGCFHPSENSAPPTSRGFGEQLEFLQAGFAEVVVQIGDQRSTMTRADVLEVIGRPLLSFISPTSGPTDGNVSITVSGSNLGNKPDEVLGVFVNGVAAPSVTPKSRTELEFLLPPGAGAQLDVNIVTIGGSSPSNRLFSYDRPFVLDISPSYAFTGPDIEEDFVLYGENFGASILADGSAGDVDWVEIGGVRCETLEFVDSGQINCGGVDGTEWENSNVNLQVAGVRAGPFRLFDPVGPPVITTISPTKASAGDTILILGSNFGRDPDKELVDITIDGISCVEIIPRGDVAASCVVPPPRPELIEAAREDPLVLAGLSVVVHTIGPQQNPDNVLFGYSDSGDAPANAPFGILAWRDVGVTTAIRVRWFYSDIPLWAQDPAPGHEEEAEVIRNFVEPATSFLISASTDPDKLTPEHLSSTDDIVERVVLINAVAFDRLIDEKRRIYAYEHTLVGFGRAPEVFTIRASNDNGPGPYSNLSNAATETCSSTEYLRTHFPLPNVTCVPCPRGAYCGGLFSENVTALTGYWRMPWSQNSLEFTKCPANPTTCFGSAGDGTGVRAPTSSSEEDSGDDEDERRRLLHTSIENEEDGLVLRKRKHFLRGEHSPPHTPHLIIRDHPTSTTPFHLEQVKQSVSEWEAWRRTLQDASSTSSNSSTSNTLYDPSMTVDDVRPKALPSLYLRPTEEETCADGHDGVACTRCKPNWARAGVFTCRPCASRAVVIFVMVVVIIVVFLVVGFVIRRTLKSKGAEGKPETAMLKILLNHAQGIGLMASFDLEWPDAAQGIFSVMDVSSAVSADVLSLDCLAQDGARDRFYTKTLGLLASPFIIIGVIVIFWLIRYKIAQWQSDRIEAREKGKIRAIQRGRLKALQNGTSDGTTPGSSPSTGAGVGSGSGAQRREAAEIIQQAFRSYRKRLRKRERGEVVERGGMQSRKLRRMSSLNSLVQAARAAQKKSATWEHTVSRAIVSIVVIMFMIHSTTTRAALSMFACTEVGRAESTEGNPTGGRSGSDELLSLEALKRTDKLDMEPFSSLYTREKSQRGDGIVYISSYTPTPSRRLLIADLDVDCDSPKAQLYMWAIALPFFIFYSIGIPLAAAFLLYQHRHELETEGVRRTLGFLYVGFRHETFAWESVNLLRKVALAVVVTFILGQDLQLSSGLLVLFVAAVLEATFQPYSLPQLNNYSITSLVVSFLSLFSGLFLISSTTSLATKEFATVVIVGSNSIFLLFSFGLLAYQTYMSIQKESAVRRVGRAISKRITRTFSARNPLISKRVLDAIDGESGESGDGGISVDQAISAGGAASSSSSTASPITSINPSIGIYKSKSGKKLGGRRKE